MPYGVKILLDSISPAGRRLTTWELSYPRFVHAELMTHRLFSRNSASSRAIPNEKLRQRVRDTPAMPVWWGKNQAGMQAREELIDFPLPDHSQNPSMYPYIVRCPRSAAEQEWLRARDLMLEASERLSNLGLHKQLCNRLIEPWMHITVIVSATNFENWFYLRDHPDAQPEIAWVAKEMHRLYRENVPQKLPVGYWHMPLLRSEDWSDAVPLAGVDGRVAVLKKVSVGRCARVSYLTHDGKRDLAEDVKLHDKLIAGMETHEPIHVSPFEHVAQALADPDEPSGNFRGWGQYRKSFAHEHFGEKMP